MRQLLLSIDRPAVPGKKNKSAICRNIGVTGDITTPLGGGVRG